MTSRSAQEIPTDNHVSGWCPHCSLFVAFTQTDSRVVWPRLRVPSNTGGADFASTSPTVSPPAVAEPKPVLWAKVWACHVCNNTVVVHELKRRTKQGSGTVTLKAWRAWPERAPRELDAYVPEKIRSLYSEASVAEEAGALRAAAVMYRAAVEELCSDMGAKVGNLQKKIEALKSLGVAEELVTDLDEARLLGNWSIHQGVEFTLEEVADVAALIDGACFEIYVQPAQRQQIRTERKQRRDANPRT